MDEQMIENMADIMVLSILNDRKIGMTEKNTIAHFKPALMWAFGLTQWESVEEKTREFLMEHDAQDEIHATL